MNQKDFIERWRRSGGAEQANSHSFLKELSQLIGVPEPDPTQPDETRNTYVFEKAVSINNGDGTFSTGRVAKIHSELKLVIHRRKAIPTIPHQVELCRNCESAMFPLHGFDWFILPTTRGNCQRAGGDALPFCVAEPANDI